MHTERIQVGIDEIIEWSKQNGRRITRRMIFDIIKEKDIEISNEEIEKAIYYIEQQDVEVMDTDEEDYFGDGASEESAVPADVRIGVRYLSLDNIVSRLRNDEIDLFPDFQRRPNLWSKEQKSRLIESLMLRIPIPSFYFDASDDNNWIVIDGLQRLSAIRGFIINGDYVLTGLEYLKDELEGLSFSELPRQYVRRIMETQLSIYTIEKGTPSKIVFNIFKRLNTGGLVLTSQEIRHALNQGNVIALVKKMAECEEFRKATDYSIKTARMLDCEYATRYIAFTRLDVSDYKGNIDEFLNEAMVMGNNLEKEACDSILADFRRTMRYCDLIFGKYSFRRVAIDGTRGPVNKALFESVSRAVSKRADDELQGLVNYKKKVFDSYKGFLDKNAEYLKAGDKYSVNRRIQLVDDMIGEMVYACRD